MMSSQWAMSHVKNVTRSMRKERSSEMMTSLFGGAPGMGNNWVVQDHYALGSSNRHRYHRNEVHHEQTAFLPL